MDRSYRGKCLSLGLALAALAMGAPLGCGSEQSKMERGVVVDEEEAVPGSASDYDMTEAERRAKEEREVEKKAAEEFDGD